MKAVFSLLLLLLFVLTNAGCNSDSPTQPVVPPSYSPMWPQHGFNGRQTGNPLSASNDVMPVSSGAIDWTYNFPAGECSDGSEFCVDSKGNIYYLHQLYPKGALYKFRQDGSVAWKIDSLMTGNFAAISLSTDESFIFFHAVYKKDTYYSLMRVDSSGNLIKLIDNIHDDEFKVVIGRDGTLYSFVSQILTAVNPNSGSVIWTQGSVGKTYYNKIALDNDDNIYTYSQTGVVKVNKSGSVVWRTELGNRPYPIVIDGYGNLYFTVGTDSLYCLNKDGKVKWKKFALYSKYGLTAVTKDNKIIATNGLYVTCYDTAGTELWRTESFAGKYTGAEGLMLDKDDNIYYIGDNGSSGISAGSISASGIKRWEQFNLGISGSLPPPVLLPQGKMLIAPKRAYKIVCLN